MAGQHISRPSKDEVMLAVAYALSVRATCIKRAVGCVLVDAKGRILATGYNGTPAGLTHCTDKPCGAGAVGSDTCQAVHAEINALMQCKDVDAIDTCYTTCMPCNNCGKSLLNTGCKRLVYIDTGEPEAAFLKFWRQNGRKVVITSDLG